MPREPETGDDPPVMWCNLANKSLSSSLSRCSSWAADPSGSSAGGKGRPRVVARAAAGLQTESRFQELGGLEPFPQHAINSPPPSGRFHDNVRLCM